MKPPEFPSLVLHLLSLAKTTVLYLLLLRLTLPTAHIRVDACQWKLKSHGRFILSGLAFLGRLLGQGYKQSMPLAVYRARGGEQLHRHLKPQGDDKKG